MSGEELKELLQMAREAEQDGDEQRAGELYQQIVDDHPYSRAAKIAGERLMKLDESTTSGSAPSEVAEADDAPETPESTDRDPNDWDGDSSRQVEPGASGDSGAMGCPQCGGTEFVYGDLTAEHGVAFDPDDNALISFDNVNVRARVCRECGNLQPYVDDPKSVG